jgi:hypothetical protein
MSSTISFIALVVSVASACFAGAAWWTSREKLRLDLYNRRFGIYSRTLDFYHALSGWLPTELEKKEMSLQDSPELWTTQKAFIKANREVGFLFDDDSGIQQQLEQMHTDSIGIIGFLRDLAPTLLGKPELVLANEGCDQRWKRVHDAIPSLEKKLSEYLDFHTLLVWGRGGRNKD